jgi:hypothetical protein
MQLGLLGFAAEIEVRFYVEPLPRLDDFQDSRSYPFRRFVEAVWSAGAIGKQNAYALETARRKLA